MFPDHFDHDWRAGSRDRLYAAIRDLEPGVTEIHVQPAFDTPEVRALSPAIRPLADYDRSLKVLRYAAERGGEVVVKSGLMVGLGETDEQIRETIGDLAEAGCGIMTIG